MHFFHYVHQLSLSVMQLLAQILHTCPAAAGSWPPTATVLPSFQEQANLLEQKCFSLMQCLDILCSLVTQSGDIIRIHQREVNTWFCRHLAYQNLMSPPPPPHHLFQYYKHSLDTVCPLVVWHCHSCLSPLTSSSVHVLWAACLMRVWEALARSRAGTPSGSGSSSFMESRRLWAFSTSTVSITSRHCKQCEVHYDYSLITGTLILCGIGHCLQSVHCNYSQSVGILCQDTCIMHYRHSMGTELFKVGYS